MTPGPWTSREDGQFIDILDARGCFVARVHFRNGDGEPDKDARENAAAIAAAPDMLKAIEELSNYLGPFDHRLVFDELAALIKKARGK